MKPKWRLEEGKSRLKRLYTSILPSIREVSRKSGYAIGLHGSMTRDLDLIAVPWIPRAVHPKTLADRISMAVCGLHQERKQPWTKKPHGRKAVVICIGMRAYIDLSVLPRRKRPTTGGGSE